MNRPLPTPTAETKPFWDGCNLGELRYQACKVCGHVQYLPRRLCVTCHSEEIEWRVSGRRGAVYSHTTVYRAPTPAFRADVPYVIALIQLDEGFRMMLNIVNCKPEEL